MASIRGDLINELENLVTEFGKRQFVFTFSESQLISTLYLQIANVKVYEAFEEEAHGLQDLVKDLDFFRFYESWKKWMRGGSGWKPSDVCWALFRLACKCQNSETAVDYLLEAATQKRIEIETFSLLWGCEVDEKIQLTIDTSLLPRKYLPEGSPTVKFINDFQNPRFGGLPTAYVYQPETVLVCTKSSIELEGEGAENITPILKFHKKISWLMNLSCESAVLKTVTWCSASDIFLNELFSNSLYYPNIEFPHPLRPRDDLNRTIDELKAKSVMETQIFEERRITGALYRLISSRIASSAEQAAIELSICLELLFQGKRTDSISYKVSTRCSRYISSTYDEFKDNCRILKDLYGLRSDTVHGNKLPSNEEKSWEKVRKADNLLSASILKMLKSNKLVDFDQLDYSI